MTDTDRRIAELDRQRRASRGEFDWPSWAVGDQPRTPLPLALVAASAIGAAALLVLGAAAVLLLAGAVL